MEAAAREGKFSREEFTQFREELNRRLRQQANEAQARSAGPAAPAAEATGIEQGLKAALEALDARAAQGKATAEDVQAVRNQLIARARAAANTAANTPVANPNALAEERALQAKWLQSLERMEAAAREGKFSREEFTQFREELNRRLRQQANEAQQQSQPAPAPLPASPQQPAERPKPEAQPAPAPQPQPQPQPQPESRPQPQPEPQPRARPTPAPAPEPQPQPEPQRPPQRPKPGG
jgi:polyhydroxyalkanoate synthesis regulator phasin